MPRKFSETFYDVILGAVPAMVFFPIAAFGSFLGMISIVGGDFKMFFNPLALMGYGGVLGMIALWWVPLSYPFKPLKKMTRNIKVTCLLAGIPPASIWMFAEETAVVRMLLILPIVVAVKQMVQLMKCDYR